MSAATPLIPARHKDVNRAKVCDDNFTEFVKGWSGRPGPMPGPDEPVLPTLIISLPAPVLIVVTVVALVLNTFIVSAPEPREIFRTETPL